MTRLPMIRSLAFTFGLIFLLPLAGLGNEKAVDAFIESYFKSWSAQDMEAYAAHFHPQSTVHFITQDEETVVTQIAADFLQGQAQAHSSSKAPMKEAPLEKALFMNEDGKSAQVRVHWELQKDGLPPERGYDLFTLRKLKGEWKIIDLTFYVD